VCKHKPFGEKFIWTVLKNKIDSNDLLRLISILFSKYQNFHALFIMYPDFIFFGDIFAEWKKGLLLHTH